MKVRSFSRVLMASSLPPTRISVPEGMSCTTSRAPFASAGPAVEDVEVRGHGPNDLQGWPSIPPGEGKQGAGRARDYAFRTLVTPGDPGYPRPPTSKRLDSSGPG